MTNEAAFWLGFAIGFALMSIAFWQEKKKCNHWRKSFNNVCDASNETYDQLTASELKRLAMQHRLECAVALVEFHLERDSTVAMDRLYVELIAILTEAKENA